MLIIEGEFLDVKVVMRDPAISAQVNVPSKREAQYALKEIKNLISETGLDAEKHLEALRLFVETR